MNKVKAGGVHLRSLTFVALSAIVLAGCATHEEAEDTRTHSPFEQREEVRAPIDDAEIVSHEDGYTLRIVSGLPNGCAEFERIDTMRSDPDVFVDVWNTMPAGDDTVCTMIYNTAENSIELGDDFRAGEAYNIIINQDTQLELRAQ